MKKEYDTRWYKSVLDAIDDMVLVKGDRSRLLWANKSFLQYYGMTEEELYNIIDSEHSDPDDTLQYVKDDNYVFSNNTTLDIPSEPVTSSDGATGYFHTIKSPICNESGNVEMSVGVSRRILDEEIIKDSVEKRSNRKEMIHFQKEFVRQVKLPSLFIDAQGRIIMVGKAFSKLFKLEPSFFQEMHISKFFPFLEGAEVQGYKESLPAKKIIVNEIELQGDLTISPWYFSEDEVGGHLILFKDRTEEILLSRQLEEEKQRSVISDRLRSLGVLSAGVGHEINNPLAIIIGSLDKILLLEKDNIKGQKVLDDLDVIKKNSIRISNIVKGLKSLSRDASSDPYEKVQVSDIIRDTFALTEGRIRNLDIQLLKSVENNSSISCKPGQITQVILNLINNSIDEIKDQEKPWIKVEALAKEDKLVFNISDSGTGIKQEVINKIFDPFYTTKTLGEGTGLGLGISMDIIKKHKGELYYNDSFKNTTFTVELPRGGQ